MVIASSHDPGIAWNFKSMTLLHLSSFTLELTYDVGALSFHSDVSDKFFSNLNLPHLTSFSHNLGANSIVSWIVLARAISIENLTLSISDLRHESVLRYLRTSTSLKWLRFTWWYPPPDGLATTSDIDELASLLANTNPGGILCPFLEVLEFQTAAFSRDVIIQIVHQRAELVSSDGIAHLKVVRGKFFGLKFDSTVISQLEDLITAGLSLSFSFHEDFCPPGHNIQYWPDKVAELEWPM
ncbi:hypothetical protein C8J56DRAFT_479514 [Mycena floridula]|nr:hypothetical protein C8J56DRAFT_479514 [Mycena floridula]